LVAVLVAVFVVVGVGGALALNSNSVGRVDTVDSASGIVGKSWADLGAEQFAVLPSGSKIVDCLPTQKRFPPGAITSQAPGFFEQHPGFYFLIDGRCALDPSAIATPMRVDWLEGSPPPETSWWSPITAVKLASLPAGTQIVNCWGNIKQLPQGVRLEVGQDFYKEHPGFHFLTDGQCALDPSAIQAPLAGDNANGGAPDTSTKVFDLQWFGTGVDGGPPVGGSSCFVGDSLNNHCGIKTNVRTSPAFLAPGDLLPPKPSAP
jgi:hypothetical protein